MDGRDNVSRDASIDIVWGDGERRFRLAIGQLRELQEKCDAGPAEILDRLASRRWRINDVRETIRLGLVGGGMPPAEAHRTIARYVDGRPWLESVPVAHAIVLAALIGAPDEPAGNGEAARAKSEADASPSPLSTKSAPQSDSLRPRSTP